MILNDKVAIVFGAGCVPDNWGNGNATAVQFAREGAKIVSVDRDPEAAERTASLVRGEGGAALSLAADVTDGEQVRRAIAMSIAEFGRLDVVHNNVGINRPGGVEETSEDEWQRIYDTNVKSIYLTVKHALPHLIAAGGGCIINISSIAARAYFGRPMLAYSSSKAAVNQMTRALACQYGPHNIRCNAVEPGMIDTPRTYKNLQTVRKGDVEAMRNARSQAVPLRRLGSPWDIAAVSAFLASDAASYISGAIIPVDGALTCAAPHSNSATPNA
jgi:NAD(P)-dependent dehydrogenase (short-subunit alcohol dehydrogenase family)